MLEAEVKTLEEKIANAAEAFEKERQLLQKQAEQERQLLQKQAEQERQLLQKQVEQERQERQSLQKQAEKERQLLQKQAEKESQLLQKQVEQERAMRLEQVEQEHAIRKEQVEQERAIVEQERAMLKEERAMREKQVKEERATGEKQVEQERAMGEKRVARELETRRELVEGWDREREGWNRELDLLRRIDVQVQEQRGVRSGQLRVLHGVMYVRAQHAGMSAEQGRPVRYRRDVHGHQCQLPGGRVRPERTELWFGWSGVRYWTVHIAQWCALSSFGWLGGGSS